MIPHTATFPSFLPFPFSRLIPPGVLVSRRQWIIAASKDTVHTPMANNLAQFTVRASFRASIDPHSGRRATLTKHRHQTPVLSLHQHHYPLPISQLKKKTRNICGTYFPKSWLARFLMRKISISIESKSGRCVRMKRIENLYQRVWGKHQYVKNLRICRTLLVSRVRLVYRKTSDTLTSILFLLGNYQENVLAKNAKEE